MEIVENMPYADYAKRPGVNASLLKLVHRKSLLHAKAYLDGKYEEESDELAFGKCFHSLALEGREDFVQIPDTYTNDKGEVKPWNWNANACKAWGDEQGDKTPLKVGEVEACRGMADSVFDYLGGKVKGRIEVSLFADKDGIPLKCRVDLLPHDKETPIVDLKSCQSAEPSKFLRSSIELGYHMQAAFALDVARLCGFERDTFSLLAVESNAPHAACILNFSDEPMSLLRLGRIHYRTALQRLINAQKTNRWDGYGEHAAENFAPAWIAKELEVTA
jgi:hypothetical protein